MIVKFKSKIISPEGVENKIEFSSPLTISEWDDFTVYEFKEPQAGESNRIEFNSHKVNIFAGRNTISLEKERPLSIEYQTQAGNVLFVSYLESLVNNGLDVKFEYTLSNNGTLIGTYQIELNVQQ